jgi:hypothetical protein
LPQFLRRFLLTFYCNSQQEAAAALLLATQTPKHHHLAEDENENGDDDDMTNGDNGSGGGDVSRDLDTDEHIKDPVEDRRTLAERNERLHDQLKVKFKLF